MMKIEVTYFLDEELKENFVILPINDFDEICEIDATDDSGIGMSIEESDKLISDYLKENFHLEGDISRVTVKGCGEKIEGE